MSLETKIHGSIISRRAVRDALGLDETVPFSQYAAYIPWNGEGVPATASVFDFSNNRYAKDGKAVYLDDISEFIRLSSATKWQNGQLVEVGDNVPRISGEGLLVEEQRTNLASWSDDASQWRQPLGGSFSTSTGGEIYHGVVSRFTEDTTDGLHEVRAWAPISVVGETHTFSLIVKPVGDRRLLIHTNFFTAGQISFYFDLEAETTTITNAHLTEVSSEVIPLGGGFYRIVWTGKSTIDRAEATGAHVRLRTTNAGELLYAGDGDSGVHIFGYQVEKDSFRTSYIPTDGAQVTRVADTLNIPLLPTQTITGDWDAGVTYEVADNIATFTGHGYIRNITVEAL